MGETELVAFALSEHAISDDAMAVTTSLKPARLL